MLVARRRLDLVIPFLHTVYILVWCKKYRDVCFDIHYKFDIKISSTIYS
jgi:hypothetical protein